MNGTVLTKCDQCRAMYAERNPPQEPPCETCIVDLLPENRSAAEIYMICRNQVIVAGMGQILDISIPAIKIVMDLYNIQDQKKCLNKVRAVFYHFLKDQEKNAHCILG